MKKVFTILAVVLCAVATFGQSYSISQNQQTINLNVPVIEKPVYIEKYRTVYVDKPQPKRVARTLTAPVQLYGYLWVYTEDIGNFKRISDAVEIVNSINRNQPFGRDDWRIPTDAELAVLENNANKVGLGDDIYISTGHTNGILRMVSTGKTVAEKKAEEANRFVDLGLSVKWSKCNGGASSPEEYGYYYTWESACAMKGTNGRCPTKAELSELVTKCKWTWTAQNGVRGMKVIGPNGNSIFLPAAGGYGVSRYTGEIMSSPHEVGFDGEYWGLGISDGDAYRLDFYSDQASVKSKFAEGRYSVRPVMNK